MSAKTKKNYWPKMPDGRAVIPKSLSPNDLDAEFYEIDALYTRSFLRDHILYIDPDLDRDVLDAALHQELIFRDHKAETMMVCVDGVLHFRISDEEIDDMIEAILDDIYQREKDEWGLFKFDSRGDLLAHSVDGQIWVMVAKPEV